MDKKYVLQLYYEDFETCDEINCIDLYHDVYSNTHAIGRCNLFHDITSPLTGNNFSRTFAIFFFTRSVNKGELNFIC